jgi:hypothetical protein
MEDRKETTFGIRLSDAERALLKKGARALAMNEADYLRVCMVLERLSVGDLDAMKILGGRLREEIGGKLGKLVRAGSLTL